MDVLNKYLIYRSRYNLLEESNGLLRRDEIIKTMGDNAYIWYWYEPLKDNRYVLSTSEIFPTSLEIKSSISAISYDFTLRKIYVHSNGEGVPYGSSKVFNVLKSIQAFEEVIV